MAELFQHGCAQRSHCLIIVHKKDIPRCLVGLYRLPDLFRGAFGNTVRISGKKNSNSGSNIRRGVSAYISAVFRDDAVDDCQAETASALRGGEIGIKYAVNYFRRDPGAFIPDGQADIFPGQVSSNDVRRLFQINAGYIQPSAVRHGLFGVDDQIGEYLADLPFVCFGGPESFL